MIPGRTSIHDRPEEIGTRQTAGHWEKDTFVRSKHNGSKAALSVTYERKSHLL